MACGGIDPANAFFWLSLGGILSGGGISFIAAPRRKSRPVVSIILLSFAVLSLLAAFYVSGFSLASIRFELYWAAVAAAAGYLCFVFWKAAGIPLLFLLIVLSVSLRIAFFDWSCVESGTEICSFSALSEGEDFIRIHSELPDGSRSIERLDRKDIYPLMRRISVPGYFFMLRTRSAYLFEGFGNESEMPEIRNGFSRLVIGILTGLPGFSLSGDSPAIKISPSVEYVLRFNGAGEAEIKRRI